MWCPYTDAFCLYEIEGLEKLCAEGTNYILIERNPSRSLSTEELNSLLQVSDLGLNPIIAHLDRYDEKSQQGLLKSGFDVQLNVSAFSKFLKNSPNCFSFAPSNLSITSFANSGVM